MKTTQPKALAGKNVLRLNGATMCRIVQHYFDTVLFEPSMSPEVDLVTYAHPAGDFKVKVGERTDPPLPKIVLQDELKDRSGEET